MRKLLWIGDAGCDSGFARATHYTLDSLRQRFEVSVLGINYRGDPHDYPYDIYPAWPGNDMFGIGRLETIVPKVRPDVIVLQNDPWNIPAYMDILQYSKIPVVASLAVDGLNCRGGKAGVVPHEGADRLDEKQVREAGLNMLSLAIFWTEFGRRAAVEGGYAGPSVVVPLGVDRSIYKPADRQFARKAVGLPMPKDAFLIGNVNRNQPRKRIDLTLMYFAEWFSRYQHEDAYLFLHIAPTGEMGYDIKQLVDYLDQRHPGLKTHVLVSQPEAYKGLAETTLSLLYNAFDVGISTSQGEGMGLPALEMMACGVPQILPDWAAYSDWAKGAACLVPCTSFACTTNSINVVGGIPDREGFTLALEDCYQHRADNLGLAGYARACEPRFDWKNIGEQFGDAICQTLWQEEAVAV